MNKTMEGRGESHIAFSTGNRSDGKLAGLCKEGTFCLRAWQGYESEKYV